MNITKKLFSKNLLYIAFILLLVQVVNADSFTDKIIWEQTAGPSGGSFNIVKVSSKDSSVIFAGSSRSLFISKDGGESWQREILTHLSAEQWVRAIEFDPRNPDVIYVGASDGIFKSENHGNSWQEIEKEYLRQVSVIAVDPEESNTIYVGTMHDGRGNIYKSNNGGVEWQDITHGLRIREVNSIVLDKGNSIWLGVGHEMARAGSLYHSTDGGSSWNIVDVGAEEDTFVSKIAINPFDSNHIIIGLSDAFNRGKEFSETHFESKDGGRSWNNMVYETRFPCPDMPAPASADIVFSKTKEGTFYLTSPTHKTTDGGKTYCGLENWNQIEGFGRAEQNSIAIDPKNENILYATYIGQGVAKSIDGGETWRLSNNGLVNAVVTNVVTDPKDEKVVYVAGGDGSGTWKTYNRGDSWEILNKGGITHPWVDELVVNPSNSDIVYNIADVGSIFRSSDAGRTWTLINEEGFTFSSVYTMTVDPTNPNTIYVINNGQGIYRGYLGEDGRSWQYLLGSPDYSYSIAVDPNDPNIIYSGYNKKEFEDESRVYKSTNSGDGWDVVLTVPGSTAVTSVVIDPQNSGRVYAASTGNEGKIYFSDDKGEYWSILNDDLSFTTIWGHSQLQIDPNDKNTVYAGTWGAGSYKTTNGGKDWTLLDQEHTFSPTCIAISKKDPNVIYACDRVSPKIHKSTDGGNTWVEYYDFGEDFMMTSAVAIDPDDSDTIYAAAFLPPMAHMGGLVKITNKEATPLGKSLPRSVLEIEIDPNDKNTIYATTHIHGVYKSTDSGNTWEKLDDKNNGLPRIGVYDIFIDSTNSQTLYATALCGELPDYMLPPKIIQVLGGVKNLDLEGKCGVYKSIDGGDNWELKLETISEARGIDIDSENSNNLFVADMMGGIWVSNDGGETWRQENDELGSKSMTSVKVRGDYIYASTQGSGVYSGKINSDGSITWDKLRSNKPKAYVSKIQLAVDPTDSNRIYVSAYPGGMLRSDDGGKNWNDKNFLTPSIRVEDPTRQGYYSFAIDPNNPAKVWLGVYGKGMFVSYDHMDFDMFANGNKDEMLGKKITFVVVDPTDSETIYVATEEGIFVTKNDGKSWDELNNGLIVKDIISLSINKNGDLFAGSRGYGVYRFNKDQNSWGRPMFISNFGAYWHWWERPLYLYNALLIHPFNSNIMYLGSFPGGFYKTYDEGETWYETNLKFTIDGTFSLVFHPYNKSIIYAGTYNGVSISRDRGKTWEKIDEGMPSEQWVFSMVFDPRDPNIIYAASKNGQNKGFCERNTFCGGVFKSYDGGENWIELTNGLDGRNEYYQLIMYPYNYDILFVSASSGVYVTLDAGKTWQDFSYGLEGIPSGAVNNVANNMEMDRLGEYLYLGTNGLGVFLADLSKLNLPRSTDVYPLHCFDYEENNDEEGIDCGGNCAVSCDNYDYGSEILRPEKPTKTFKEFLETQLEETKLPVYILLIAIVLIVLVFIIIIIKRKRFY